MHTDTTTDIGGAVRTATATDIGQYATRETAPRDWLGTPMEMVAGAFGMKRPWLSGQNNLAAHRRKVQARRDRRSKLAKQARRRNRK